MDTGPDLILEAHDLYRTLLGYLGIAGIEVQGEVRQSAPYKLLVGEDWMLAVPRVAEYSGSVSVNALGFAGSLFVKDRERLDVVRAAGPMTVLRAAAGPA